MKIGLVLNGGKTEYPDYTSLTKDCFLMFLPKMNFQSVETIRDNVSNLIEMLVEYLQDAKKSPIEDQYKKEVKNLHTRLVKLFKYFPKISDRENQITGIWNFLLALEGCGNLSGFGFGNKFGDKLTGNAERETLTARTSTRR